MVKKTRFVVEKVEIKKKKKVIRLNNRRERIVYFGFLFFNFILLLIIFYILYMTWQKMVMRTYDWVLSWHLTEGALTYLNGMAHLIAK